MTTLFTRDPLPSPSGYVPLNRAMLCLDDHCDAIFVIGPACPRCASERMMPLETWLNRQREETAP